MTPLCWFVKFQLFFSWTNIKIQLIFVYCYLFHIDGDRRNNFILFLILKWLLLGLKVLFWLSFFLQEDKHGRSQFQDSPSSDRCHTCCCYPCWLKSTDFWSIYNKNSLDRRLRFWGSFSQLRLSGCDVFIKTWEDAIFLLRQLWLLLFSPLLCYWLTLPDYRCAFEGLVAVVFVFAVILCFWKFDFFILK